jgi:transcription termination/antitermination factor NusG
MLKERIARMNSGALSEYANWIRLRPVKNFMLSITRDALRAVQGGMAWLAEVVAGQSDAASFAESIIEQAKQSHLSDQIEEVLVPTEEVVEMRRGAKVKAERKFFPGYVLVKMEMTDEAWHLVKDTPKVTGFLGGRGRPSPITETEAMRIISQVKEGIERPKPSVQFEIGEQVRVCDGPFNWQAQHRNCCVFG